MTARRVVVTRRPARVGRASVAPGRPDAVGHECTACDTETRAIMARQLPHALATVGATAVVLAGLPLLAGLLDDARWWLALSLVAQPVWVALAVHQLKRAERLER